MKKILIFAILALSFESFAIEIGIEDALLIAEKQNLTIRKESINLENGKKDIEIAKDNKKPKLKGTISSKTGLDGDDLTYNRSLSTSYTIFDGGSLNNQIKQSEKNYDLLYLNLDQNKKDIKKNVVEEFINIIKYKKSLEIYQKQYNEQGKEYEKVKIKYDNKTTSKSEFLSIEGSILETETNIINTKNSYLSSIETLKNLLNLKDEIIIKEPKVEIKNLFIDEDLKEAELENLDLKKQKINIDLAEISQKNQKTNYLPELALKVSYDNSGEEISDIFENRDLSVSLSLTYDIFDWGIRKEELVKSKNEITKNQIELESMKNLLNTKIKSKYLELKKYEQLIVAQNKKIESYKQNLDIDKVKYESRSLALKDYLESQNEYWNAKVDLENFYLDYYLALYVYKDLIK